MLSTVVQYREPMPLTNTNSSSAAPTTTTTTVFKEQSTSAPKGAVIYSDFVLAIVVFVEFLIRLIVCPDKKTFFTSFAAFADVAHVIPVFTLHISGMVNPNFWRDSAHSKAFIGIQMSVCLRVLRLHRFASCIRGFNVLALALRASLKELILLGLLALFAAIVFAFALFYVEMSSQDSFSNAFYAMWWALITMTSVGYGDFYPTSPLGYVLGVSCAFVGLILISLPVPMVANNFNLYYAYKRRNLSTKRATSRGEGNEAPILVTASKTENTKL